MTALRALFRVAAGGRLGHGHLRRAEVLAAALGATAAVSVRGVGAPTLLPAAPGSRAGDVLDLFSPDLLVLDDPHPRHGERWCRAAARRGLPVVSIHDLGLGRVSSTLAIDGSVDSPARGWPAAAVRRGPAYAIIRRPVARRRRARLAVRRVLVSLGGGPRTGLMRALAREIVRRHDDVEVLVAAPAVSASSSDDPRIHHRALPNGLAPVFAEVDLAVLGGGVSLYEAASAGVPAVAIAVVEAQRPTIRGFERAGVVRAAGRLTGRRADVLRALVARVSDVIADAAWRRQAALAGPRLVDGRGASRVAADIRALLRGRSA